MVQLSGCEYLIIRNPALRVYKSVSYEFEKHPSNSRARAHLHVLMQVGSQNPRLGTQLLDEGDPLRATP